MKSRVARWVKGRGEVRSGSKADLNPGMLKVRSFINSGHSPKWQSGFFVLKNQKFAYEPVPPVRILFAPEN
jgi:hypothetical protein